MQYLVTIETSETAPFSEQQRIQLLEQAVVPTLEACAKLEAEQKIVAGGVSAGAGSAMLLVNAASNDEINQVVASLPAWGVLKVVVTPLQSFAERAAQERQALAQKNDAAGPSVRDQLHQHLGQLRDWAGK